MAKATHNTLDPARLPELMTTRQASALLGICEASVRRMAASGKIPANKVGEKLWRIPKRAVLEKMGITPGI